MTLKCRFETEWTGEAQQQLVDRKRLQGDDKLLLFTILTLNATLQSVTRKYVIFVNVPYLFKLYFQFLGKLWSHPVATIVLVARPSRLAENNFEIRSTFLSS